MQEFARFEMHTCQNAHVSRVSVQTNHHAMSGRLVGPLNRVELLHELEVAEAAVGRKGHARDVALHRVQNRHHAGPGGTRQTVPFPR